jgi:hypothetical protein
MFIIVRSYNFMCASKIIIEVCFFDFYLAMNEEDQSLLKHQRQALLDSW